MPDEVHDDLLGRLNDNDAYTLGSIKKHNIIIAYLPEAQYRTNNAAKILTNLTRTFPSVRRGLMVDIGGGALSKVDIRLGDVIVGMKVIQYDLGMVIADSEF